MVTKKLLAAGFGLFSGLLLTTGSAHAVNIASTILGGQLQQWSDNSAESQHVDGNGNGFLDVGDTLRGVFQIETREDLQAPNSGTVVYGGGGVNELTGIFEISVVSRTQVSNGDDGIAGNADDRYNFTFGVYAPFQAEFGLNAGTMAVFFEDTTPDFDRTGTIATAEATSTNGTKVVEIGFTGDLDEAWNASNAPQDPSLGAGVPQGTGLGTFNFSLGFLYNVLFGAAAGVDAGACFPLCAGDGLVGINASGGISGTRGSDAENDIFNNVDMVFRPLPEPGTLGMLGLGLVAMGFILRTRQRKSA
jgi:hypothetical protein